MLVALIVLRTKILCSPTIFLMAWPHFSVICLKAHTIAKWCLATRKLEFFHGWSRDSKSLIYEVTISLGSRNGHFKVSNQMDPWCFDHSVYRLIIYPFVRFCDWIIKFWTFCSHKIQWSKHSVSMCIGKSIWNPLGMGFHMIKIFIVCTKIRIQSLLSRTVGSEFWYSRDKNFKY